MKAGTLGIGRWLFLLVALCGVLRAQQPIGTVGVQDATVAGALEVTNGRAVLVGNTTVTARDHMAEIALNRGGSVHVCSTSGLHVTAGKSATGADPLMLALDRGAIEVQMAATTSDVVMTPDLRFTMVGEGPLDLRLRVIRNGDTCVENRGEKAPVVRVAEQFGDAVYELRPGQHVLFEHGSLKDVVDKESSPCGCPPVPVVSVADAGVTSATPAAVGGAVAAKTVEEQHPFPAAVSAELAPGAVVPQAAPGVAHEQVAAALRYDAATPVQGAAAGGSVTTGGDAGASPGTTNAMAGVPVQGTTTAAPVAAVAQAPPPPPAPPVKDVAHSIGRFFKRLFGRR